MPMKYLILFPIVVSSIFMGCGAENVSVVDNGQARATVILSDNPTPMAEYAADELVTHIRKATGVDLAIRRESDILGSDNSKVFVGITRAARRLGIEPETLGPDEFVLRTEGNNLYVVGDEAMDVDPLDERGHSKSGTLFGVYELLERYLNVRWLWPGELGTYIPSTDELTIGPLDEVVGPALEFRRFRWR